MCIYVIMINKESTATLKENKEGYMGGLGGRIGGSMEEVLGVDPYDKRIQKS